MLSQSSVCQTVARILECAMNNMEKAIMSKPCKSLKRFDSITIPKVSISEYLDRIRQYTKCSDSCFVFAFIYIDRLLQNISSSKLTMKNIHRLILAAIVLAIKYLDDSYYDNETYAKVGGVSLSEINSLESHMLFLINYNLYVDNELYYQYDLELKFQYMAKIEEEMQSQSEPMNCEEEDLCSLNLTKTIGNIRSVPSFATMDQL